MKTVTDPQTTSTPDEAAELVLDQTLPCLVCGNACEPVDADEAHALNQPYDATSFSTGGHYGSTCFDPGDRTRLEVNICRDCLHGAAAQGRVAHVGSKTRTIERDGRPYRHTEPTYVPWVADDHQHR